LANILITGGTGSLGSALVDSLIPSHNLTIYSKDAHKQDAMLLKYPAQLSHDNFVHADIADRDALRFACAGQDVVIHTAAQKILQHGEMHTAETMRVNYLGTQHLVWAWQQAAGVADSTVPAFRRMAAAHPRTALYIQSDKAVMPVNLYGFSKAAAEKAWVNELGGWALRYGNVVGSRGSFIHEWLKLVAKGKPVMVREPAPTRFFLTMQDAIKLVMLALKHVQSLPPERNAGGVLIPCNVPAFNILSLAESLTSKIDSRPLLFAEKQHETLLAANEVALPIEGEVRIAEVASRYDVDNAQPLLMREQYDSGTTRNVLAPGEVIGALGLEQGKE
jgi:UDP-N-acetylglucosamine 4,6-dehydratase/5-epimerase